MHDDLITIDEACELVNKTRETLRRAARDGRLVRVRVPKAGRDGSYYRVRRADVLALWPPRELPRCDVCGEVVSEAGRRHRRCVATPPGWLTIREAAAVLGCSYQNVNQLIRGGTLPDLRPETVEAYKSGYRRPLFRRRRRPAPRP